MFRFRAYLQKGNFNLANNALQRVLVINKLKQSSC